MSLLETKNLCVHYPIRSGLLQRIDQYVRAVQNVSITVDEGEIVSIVGESGCGKSSLAQALIGLTPIESGLLKFKNSPIDVNKTSSWNPWRKDIQMIFQDPFNSLNPRHTVFEALAEPLRFHKICDKNKLKETVAELLQQVDMNLDSMNRYPHAFSGGQRQRLAIAKALSLNPKMIICDEIVSALDVSVQAQILELLIRLKKEKNLALLFISHDLSVVKLISDRVYVMYSGNIVEEAPPDLLFNHPKHPYTQALIRSIPTLNRSVKPECLEGDVPSPVDLPQGCAFKSRCKISRDLCLSKPYLVKKMNHSFACHLPLS